MDHPSTENLFSILCCNTEIDVFTWNSPIIEITEGRLEGAYIHIDVDHPGNNKYFCLYCGDPFPSLVMAFEHGRLLHPRKRPSCFSKPDWLCEAHHYRMSRQRTPLQAITHRVSRYNST